MTCGDATLYRWAKTSGEMPPAQAWLDDIGPRKCYACSSYPLP